MTREELIAGKHVLFVQRSAHRDGSAVSGLMIVKALVDVGASVQVCFGHDGEVIEDYRRLGCECMVVPHGDWLRPGGILKSARRLRREWIIGNSLAKRVSSSTINLIYVNDVVGLSGAVAAKKLAVPCVWHLRAMFADVGGEMHPPAFGGKGLVRSLLRKLSDQIVINSVAVGENILGPRLNGRAVLIDNAVPDDAIDQAGPSTDLRVELGIQPSTFLVAIVGSSRLVKGHSFFLGVLQRLVRAGEDVAALFAGNFSGEYGRTIKCQVQELGLQDRVHILGTSNDVRSVYRSCDLVCIPSLSESFGRVAIEAFFAKKPVAASAVGGLKEIVSHGETGFLFKCKDEQSLLSCLLLVMRDPVARENAVENAEIVARQRFTEAKHRTAILEVVQTGLENSRRL